MTSIGSSVFYNCKGLTQIIVDGNNSSFASQDGLLFNKTKTVLLQYPTGKSGQYEIPNSVTSIGNSAVSSCTGLTKVIIPDSVTSIGDNAFFGCKKLTAVYFLGNAPKASDVFYIQSTILKVYYINGNTGFTNPWYGCSTISISALPFLTEQDLTKSYVPTPKKKDSKTLYIIGGISFVLIAGAAISVIIYLKKKSKI